MRLGGKVAVVTGAASRISHAIALFAEGATVYATDIAPGEFRKGHFLGTTCFGRGVAGHRRASGP